MLKQVQDFWHRNNVKQNTLANVSLVFCRDKVQNICTKGQKE